MQILFKKYQGTGNDFVIIDNRKTKYLDISDADKINQLCDRRFGIGADGLILLENQAGYDFKMIYFNADGNESSMCGNGGRCIVAFAKSIGIIKEFTHFMAIDGEHEAKINDNNWIELKMCDVVNVEIGEGYYILNTGSPHYIVFTEDISDIDIVENGQAIRYSDRFKKEGINVNFVEIINENSIEVATYERGVEDETWSCGTGVTAAAIAFSLQKKLSGKQEIAIKTKGGNLKVRFSANGNGTFDDIWLCGPATNVFNGAIEI